MDMDRPSAYRLGASSILVAAAAFELGRIATNIPWRGFAPWISHTASGALALLFLATAAAVAASHVSVAAGRAAGVLGAIAVPVMAAHGLVTRVGGTVPGLAYVGVAALVGFLLTRALKSPSLPWRRAAGGAATR
jgi:hypothetical protein